MRQIRLRAWDNVNQVMGDVLQYLPYAGENGIVKIETSDGIIYMSHDFDLMQSTGLQDKNGKEIYEGDVVKDGWKEDNIGVVTFSDGSFQSGIGYIECLSTQLEDAEVIGNIYEHPSLLK